MFQLQVLHLFCYFFYFYKYIIRGLLFLSRYAKIKDVFTTMIYKLKIKYCLNRYLYNVNVWISVSMATTEEECSIGVLSSDSRHIHCLHMDTSFLP